MDSRKVDSGYVDFNELFKTVRCFETSAVLRTLQLQDPPLNGCGLATGKSLSELFIANVKRPWPFLSILLTNQ